MWPPLITSHSSIQTLTNQKSRTVFSWFPIGLNLYETMGINQKRSHFWAPCCNGKESQAIKGTIAQLHILISVLFLLQNITSVAMPDCKSH